MNEVVKGLENDVQNCSGVNLQSNWHQKVSLALFSLHGPSEFTKPIFLFFNSENIPDSGDNLLHIAISKLYREERLVNQRFLIISSD